MDGIQKKLNIFVTVLLVIAALFLSVTLLKTITGSEMSIFGFRVYHILTGSMEPTIRTGSDIIVKSVDPSSLKEGDIISFVSRDNAIYGNTCTHRIVSIQQAEDGSLNFLTKGDANNSVDSLLVNEKDVKGKVVKIFNLTGLRTFYDFVHTGPGFMTAIGLPILFVSWCFIQDFKRQVDELIANGESEEETKE